MLCYLCIRQLIIVSSHKQAAPFCPSLIPTVAWLSSDVWTTACISCASWWEVDRHSCWPKIRQRILPSYSTIWRCHVLFKDVSVFDRVQPTAALWFNVSQSRCRLDYAATAHDFSDFVRPTRWVCNKLEFEATLLQSHPPKMPVHANIQHDKPSKISIDKMTLYEPFTYRCNNACLDAYQPRWFTWITKSFRSWKGLSWTAKGTVWMNARHAGMGLFKTQCTPR